MAFHKHRNALARETSPYLLQHADNPVQWYPWGPEALELARSQNKPILLSIGYSACHWCHVMAHESFEDEETAALMNDLFVNIKVDREERPDLDRIHQLAHYLLTRRNGGWPLTMFLSHDDQTPFFGGTYFPREPRHGLMAFKDVLRRVARFYRERQSDIRSQNQALLETFAQLQPPAADPSTVLGAEPLERALRQAREVYDPSHGGFGPAPKFPHPGSIERLLRQEALARHRGEADPQAREMALDTLERMALGGIYDQLGGGFCRYSVDERWMIPHFEKMLYDNGPLLALYSDAWRLSGEPLFQKTALETADWALREMQSPEGGFYSSLDADSEGEEGRFYVWSREEVQGLLEPEEFRLLSRHFGLDGPANFEGRWHLHVQVPVDRLAEEAGRAPEAVRAILDEARAKLLVRRQQRIPPMRDEKILTAWNALMIRGLAAAARAFIRPDYAEAAGRALDFIRDHLWQQGRLLATCKDGRAHLNAYLDDYAFLLDAVLALLEVRWRAGDLRFAVELADALLSLFEDQEDGGFHFTSHDHERLIQRPKPYADDALPAGNGIAAMALGRLGLLLGDSRYLESAERTLMAAWPSLLQAPFAHCAMLLALEEQLHPTRIVVLRGESEVLAHWQQQALSRYAPRRMVLAIPDDEDDLPGALAARAAMPQGPVAYVCEGLSCSPPIATLAELKRQMAVD